MAEPVAARPAPSWWQVGLLALLLAFGFQGSRGLWEPDEGRYCGIAGRMLRTGDLLTPGTSSDVPHFTKPPLTYWAVAGSAALCGRNEWGARLPNALAYAATILAVYGLARVLVPERPWLPAVLYASFLGPFVAASTVTADTLLALWETLAVWGFVRWHADPARGRRWRFLMWLGFSLAFLTKGPPGLLPLAAIAAALALAGAWRSLARLVSPSGALVFIVVGLGWYLAVASVRPHLLGYFLRDELVKRVVTDAHARNPEWYMAFALYLPALALGALPWSAWWARAAPSVARRLSRPAWWRSPREEDFPARLLALWVLVPLAVFMLSRSRLPLYVLPLLAPLALLTGRMLPGVPGGRWGGRLLGMWLGLLLVIRLGSSCVPYAKNGRPVAEAVAALQPVPARVVYVDTRPCWGLGFYVGCDVVEACTGPVPGGSRRATETLADEVGRRLPATLFVTEQDDRGSIGAALAALGCPVRAVAERGHWVFLAPAEAAP